MMQMARSTHTTGTKDRIPVGIWAQWPPGAKWSNEGMTRLLGFLIEGIAIDGNYIFRIVLPDSVRVEAEADLRTLQAEIGRDFTLHSPGDHGIDAPNLPDLVQFANRHVEVSGWLSVFPNFSFATGLEKPLAVIFPDAIPKIFHEYSDLAWGENGNHYNWERLVSELVQRADRLVTFSEHVRDNQLCKLFNIHPSKVAVVPHAAPDLAPSLPFVSKRARTPKSLGKAAGLLREHAKDRGWTYLQDYPFEEVPFLAVSTQDRVTKNIRLILDAAVRLIRDQRRDLKILSTAPLHYGATWTPVPSMIEDLGAHRDLISMPDLPREQHAALFHCAAVAVHASIFEGGHAPFPFYEAVSVGTPCLFAKGPHVSELVASEPKLARFSFDPNDAEGLMALIVEIIDQRDSALAEQKLIYERLRRRRWCDVSAAYAQAATAGPL